MGLPNTLRPPGLLPQSRLATRAGLDLLRLLGYVERQIRRMRPCQSHVPPDKSLAISSELGMRPLMERVLSRREILKA